MTYRILTVGLMLASTLSAYGQDDRSVGKALADSESKSAENGEGYSASGKATVLKGSLVTIQHGPVEGIGWPAMTMSFAAPTDHDADVKVGDEVDFSFRKDRNAYALTALRKRL
jgi:Cu/Ag efflux protein CusF